MAGDQSSHSFTEVQPKSGSGIQWLAQEMRSDAFWRHLPPDIQASLTPAQEAAIRAVAAGTEPTDHTIDYRASMHLPILGNIYVVLLAGHDRRNQLRRSLDHALRPSNHWSHVIASIVAAIVGLGMLSAIGLLLYTLLK
jgi:hypothetical protein